MLSRGTCAADVGESVLGAAAGRFGGVPSRRAALSSFPSPFRGSRVAGTNEKEGKGKGKGQKLLPAGPGTNW